VVPRRHTDSHKRGPHNKCGPIERYEMGRFCKPGTFAADHLACRLGGLVMAHFGDIHGRKRMFTLSSYLTDRVFANISCRRSGGAHTPTHDAGIARNCSRRRSTWRMGVCRRARATPEGRTCYWIALRLELRNTAGISDSSRPQYQVQSGRDRK
jgi:hypothetical protein